MKQNYYSVSNKRRNSLEDDNTKITLLQEIRQVSRDIFVIEKQQSTNQIKHT